MATRRFSTASIKTGSKSNKLWDQDTAQGAMEPIASITSPSTNTSFMNIPQSYQDLRLVISASIGSAGSYPFVSLNNTATTASHTRLSSNGSSAISDRRTNDGVWYWGGIPFSPNSIIVGSLILDILNYKNSIGFKTAISRWSQDLNGSGEAHATVHLNQTTSAVTRIDFAPNAGPFSFYTATLYGIKAGA